MRARAATLTLVVALALCLAGEVAGAAKVHRVGMLWYGRPLDSRRPVIEAFKHGLSEQGFDGPIVMIAGDPAMFTNLARPGGNVTGLSALAAELAGKQMELVKETVPGLTRVAMFRNPAQPVHAAKVREVERVAQALKVEVQVLEVRGPQDFEAAFAAATRARAGALIVPADGTYIPYQAQLTELATRHRLPAISGSGGYARAGGLMDFVPSETDAYRSAARYVARIFTGASPGDLPIEQPTRFHLTVNARTARGLGITVPPTILLRADEVIE